MKRILVINPGSTSTKIAIFENEALKKEIKLTHESHELEPYETIAAQYDFRKDAILSALSENGYTLDSLDAVVGRGGYFKPIPSGVYKINETMKQELIEARYGEHASNLGALIADAIASSLDIPAFTMDPIVVDEMHEIAKIAGHPSFKRTSIFHALNQKAISRRFAKEQGKKYEDLNLIVAHMGGGISVGLHVKGQVVDVNNAVDGDGAFSPERSGTLPVGQLVSLCFSGKYSEKEIRSMIKGKGGLVAWLDTNDMRIVEDRVDKGDEKAILLVKALAYNISKNIGALAAANGGKIDAILLTGGLMYDRFLPGWLKEHVDFIAPVHIYPGEDELDALALGTLSALNGEMDIKAYN
jgi:butyrate kinase